MVERDSEPAVCLQTLSGEFSCNQLTIEILWVSIAKHLTVWVMHRTVFYKYIVTTIVTIMVILITTIRITIFIMSSYMKYIQQWNTKLKKNKKKVKKEIKNTSECKLNTTTPLS